MSVAALPHLRMRAHGAPILRRVDRWIGPDDGVDLGRTQGLTKTIATRYARSDKAGKGRILDELCAMTGWHRNHARKALKQALRPKIVKARHPRPPKYGPKVVAALIFCWAALGMPAGKRLAPVLPELVAILRRFGELDIDDDTATLLVGMSAATIDRRLARERKKHELKGRIHTKPGSLLKSQIPIRTWADWDDAVPGFVEIDLVGHEGGNAAGEHAYTLTVTDIATGWTENRSVRNKARKWVLAALDDIARTMPFPILGVDSDNGSSSSITTCSPGAKSARSPSPGRGRATPTTAATSSRRTGRSCAPWSATTATTPRQNCCCSTRSGCCSRKLTNYFQPQQKLVSKVRDGAKVSKKYDTATTRTAAPNATKVSAEDKAILADTYTSINPAAVQRQIQALTSELLTLTTSKAGPKAKEPVTATLRAHPRMSQRIRLRAHLDMRQQGLERFVVSRDRPHSTGARSLDHPHVVGAPGGACNQMRDDRAQHSGRRADTLVVARLCWQIREQPAQSAVRVAQPSAPLR